MLTVDVLGLSLSKSFYFAFDLALFMVVNLILCLMSEAVREQDHVIAMGHPAEIDFVLYFLWGYVTTSVLNFPF